MRKIFTLLFLLISFQAYGAEDIVIKSQEKYKTVNSFTADFTQVLTHQESNTTEERSGTLKFMKPLLLNFYTSKPAEELLVVGSKEIWDYLPQEELAYKYSLELALDSKSLISVITGQSPLNQDFEIESLDPEDGYAKFLLYPYEASSQLVEAIIWIDPKTYLIQKVRIMDLFGNLNQIALSNVQINAPIAADEFNFVPPKGIDVEDLTDPENPITRPLFN